MGRIPARKSLVAVALQGLLTAGCGTTGSEESRLTMLLSTNSATIGQGSNSTVLVNFTRSNFDKPITLVAEGTLPSGVTATFSVNPVPTGLVASTLTIAAAGSATPGVATITIRATGEGVAEQSAMISVTVNVTGTFTLGVLAPTHTVAAAGGGKATVLVTRAGGNAANVTLGVSGLPAGVTASFDQSPTTQGAASLSFTATGGAAPGSYPLTVTGSAPGVTPDQQTSLTLTVIAPPATASVTVTFCPTGIPAWFAFQNEGFGWQRATASANTFTFSATQKVAVAYTFLIGSESQTNVLYLTRSELASFSDRDCGGPKTLNGTTVGVNPGQSALVVMGIGDDATDGSGPFVLANLATRPLDLVATRGVFSSFGYLAPDRMIVRRAVDLPTGSTIPPLDFAAAESFAPVAHTLTVTGLGPSDFVEFQNNLFSATSTFGTIHSGQPVGASATLYSAPAAQLVAGDMHELTIFALESNVTGRTYVAYFDAPGDRTDVVGPNLSAPTLTSVSSTPYARARGQVPSQIEYPSAADFVIQQGAPGSRRFVILLATATHFGATPTTWDLVVPDFVGTDGFNANWMPSSGQALFAAEAYSMRTTVLFGALPVPGDVIKVAFRELGTTLPQLRARTPSIQSIRSGRPSIVGPQYLRR